MDGGENGSKLAAVCDKFGPPPEGANAFDLQFSEPQEAPQGEPQTQAVKQKPALEIESAAQYVFTRNE